MLAVLLATALTFDQAMRSFDEFCSRAEIEVNHPITTEMVTKRIEHLDKGDVSVVVQDRYRIEYYGGRVRGFADRKQNGRDKLGRLDPEEMLKWSQQQPAIDEAGAREIAKRIFLRMGFDENDFDSVEVHRFSWQPSEADPEHVLWLPLFHLMWYQKGHPRDQAVPPGVQMNISGTTKKLVYYLDSTRQGLRALTGYLAEKSWELEKPPAPLPPEGILSTCRKFFGAVGIDPASNWQQATVVTNVPPEPVRTFVNIQDRYEFELRGPAVTKFSDRDQWYVSLSMEERTNDLARWARISPTITESQAVEIARQLLGNLGFEKRTLTLSKTDRDAPSVDDPAHPGASRALPPAYRFMWVTKPPWWARHGMPDIITTEISSVTGQLVHYQRGVSTYRFWPFSWLKWLTFGSLGLALLLLILRRRAIA